MTRGTRGKTIAFRALAWIGAALHLASVAFLGASFTAADMRIHVVHNTAGFAVFSGVIAFGWILAAVAPDRMIAPFQAASAAVVCVAVAAALSLDPKAALFSAPLGVMLILLHPSRPVLWRMGRTAPVPLALTALVAIPAIWFALSNAALQRNGAPMDPHVEMDHWAGMAAFALALVLIPVVVGLGGRNRRIVAVAFGASVVLVGGVSLGYSRYPGAIARGWAIGSMVWGLALAGDGWRMEREQLRLAEVGIT